jgi:uncharacterized repeat protein (TIGR03803 family)
MTSLKAPRSAVKTTVGLLLNLLLIFASAVPVRAQTVQIVRDFEQNGRFPGSAIEGSDGFLYGTTPSGGGVASGGTVFKIAKDGSGFTLLKAFQCGPGEGCNPGGALIEGSDGFLYGTTRSGGAEASGGTVFKLAKDGPALLCLSLFNAARPTAATCKPL